MHVVFGVIWVENLESFAFDLFMILLVFMASPFLLKTEAKGTKSLLRNMLLAVLKQFANLKGRYGM